MTVNPVYAHKILHIFRCSLAEVPQATPSEQDSWQLDCVWVDLNDIQSINLLPSSVKQHIHHLIYGATPLYLGTHLIDLK